MYFIIKRNENKTFSNLENDSKYNFNITDDNNKIYLKNTSKYSEIIIALKLLLSFFY